MRHGARGEGPRTREAYLSISRVLYLSPHILRSTRGFTILEIIIVLFLFVGLLGIVLPRISLEENGYERPFINLSGGEQMAAALSVRLALLKQLSDVRLAFFDEPTTNMDAERRERLAEQISHITERKTFDQLFVISHDDTFEGYVDNVISVGGYETQ